MRQWRHYIVTLEEQVVAACPVVGMVLAIERDHNVLWHTVRAELQIPAPGDAGRMKPTGITTRSSIAKAANAANARCFVGRAEDMPAV